MTKEKTQEKYRKDTGLEPLTKAGAKTKAYSDYLLDPKNCTVPWLSNWAGVYKKNKENPYTKASDLVGDLKTIDRENRLAERCVIDGAGRGTNIKDTAKFRRESKAKFDIKNY